MSRFALFTLAILLFSPQAIANTHQTKLNGPQIWEQIFVPTLQEKFRRDNHSLSKVEGIIKDLGGKVILDHGGTRTADPQVYAFLTRIANAFGLVIKDQYKFPSKHLEAIDLQLPGSNGFKWFSTLIKYDDLSQEVAKLVEVDNQDSRPHLSERGLYLLEKLEENKSLASEEANELVNQIVHQYFRRHGRPISKDALLTIAEESPETANALLLGPDFNHLSISVNHLGIPNWYGLEVVEVLEQKMKSAGFTMLPEIQGPAGSKLRQTSIVADNNSFPVLLEGGITSSHLHPSKYVEFVQRGPETDGQGNIQFTGNTVRLYQGFLRENAEKIYSATDPRP